jgi:hypothetical protein
MPTGFAEPASARAADAYKLALLVLRLFARSHDARALGPYARYVPVELRSLLARGLERDVANRPPAGEWQLALSGLIARPDLNERYPGPAPPVRTVPPARPAPVGGAERAPVASGLARSALSASPARPAGAWLRPAVAAMWLIAGTVVLVLLLSRLFAAAVPAQGAGRFEGTPQGGYQNYAPQSYAPQSYSPQNQGFVPGG